MGVGRQGVVARRDVGRLRMEEDDKKGGGEVGTTKASPILMMNGMTINATVLSKEINPEFAPTI